MSRSKRNKPKKTEKSNDSNIVFIRSLASIMNEVGIPGFLILIGSVVFLLFSTVAQKREFIDLFILLKNSSTNYIHPALVIVLLIITLVVISIFCKKNVNLYKAETKRIGLEKSDLQQLFIKKELNSSDKK